MADIAAETGTHADTVRRLLRSLSGVGVLTQQPDDAFGLTALGRTLAAGVPDSIRDYAITLMETYYAPFAEFVETVRTGVPPATVHYGQPFMDWPNADAQRADAFSAGMAAITAACSERCSRGIGCRTGPPSSISVAPTDPC